MIICTHGHKKQVYSLLHTFYILILGIDSQKIQKELDAIVQKGLNSWKIDFMRVIEDVKNVYK